MSAYLCDSVYTINKVY